MGNERHMAEIRNHMRKQTAFFFFLTSARAKGENNGGSYPLAAVEVHSRTKTNKQKKNTRHNSSEEWKTPETFPLLLSMHCCFPLWGQERTLQSSCNKQLSLSLNAINP